MVVNNLNYTRFFYALDALPDLIVVHKDNLVGRLMEKASPGNVADELFPFKDRKASKIGGRQLLLRVIEEICGLKPPALLSHDSGDGRAHPESSLHFSCSQFRYIHCSVVS